MVPTLAQATIEAGKDLRIGVRQARSAVIKRAVAQGVAAAGAIGAVGLDALRDVGADRVLREAVEHEIADRVGRIGESAVPREGGDLEIVILASILR